MNCLSSIFWSSSFSSYPLPPTLKFVGDPVHITAKVWYALTALSEFAHRQPKGFCFLSTLLWQHTRTIVKENVLPFIWTSAGVKAVKDAEQSRVSLVEHLTLCLGGKFVCGPFDSSGTCTSTPCSILASALPPNWIRPLARACLCYCRNRGREIQHICHWRASWACRNELLSAARTCDAEQCEWWHQHRVSSEVIHWATVTPLDFSCRVFLCWTLYGVIFTWKDTHFPQGSLRTSLIRLHLINLKGDYHNL